MQLSGGSAFSQLRDKLTEWNAQNLGAITLKDDVAAYLSEMLG